MLYDKKWDRPDVDVVGQVLLDAADYIDEHGWCQLELARDGRVCAIGALVAVAGDRQKLFNAANCRLFNYLGVEEGDIGLWNDRGHRTQAEVVAALRAAAWRFHD